MVRPAVELLLEQTHSETLAHQVAKYALEMERRAQDLVKAIADATPAIDAAFALQQIRGGCIYEGPTYGKELQALCDLTKTEVPA